MDQPNEPDGWALLSNLASQMVDDPLIVGIATVISIISGPMSIYAFLVAKRRAQEQLGSLSNIIDRAQT